MTRVLDDSAPIIEVAKALLEKHGETGCYETAGEIPLSLFGGGDVYIMKHIIHGWNDAVGVRIF